MSPLSSQAWGAAGVLAQQACCMPACAQQHSTARMHVHVGSGPMRSAAPIESLQRTQELQELQPQAQLVGRGARVQQAVGGGGKEAKVRVEALGHDLPGSRGRVGALWGGPRLCPAANWRPVLQALGRGRRPWLCSLRTLWEQPLGQRAITTHDLRAPQPPSPPPGTPSSAPPGRSRPHCKVSSR